MDAVEHGYRLRVPATYLWFNLQPSAWTGIRDTLVGVGAEVAQGGLDGEELCAVAGMTVEFRAAEQRMQAEVSMEGGSVAAACLSALRAAAPKPDAEASPVWLWSPEPFTVGQEAAERADRLLRAARWRLPRLQGSIVLEGLGAALEVLDASATVQLEVQAECFVTVTTPLAIADRSDRERRTAGFEILLSHLGQPVRADHVTFA